MTVLEKMVVDVLLSNVTLVEGKTLARWSGSVSCRHECFRLQYRGTSHHRDSCSPDRMTEIMASRSNGEEHGW